MLRSLALVLVGVIVFSVTSLFADEEQKPKSPDKSDVKKSEANVKNIENKSAKDGEGVKKKFTKGGDENPSKGDEKNVKGGEEKRVEKKSSKDGEENSIEKKPIKGDDTPKDGEKKPVKEKPHVAVVGSETDYYTSSPAQGRPADGKLKSGTKVRVLEKAGSYVRVVAQVEVFVPVESLNQPSVEKKGPKKGDGEKGAADKEAAAEKKSAIENEAPAEKKKAAIKEGEKKDPEKKKDGGE